MYRGQIRFELPMMWVVAFMLTFVVGGMTGVLLAVPPADFVLHNSLFLVAHFHNVIIGGVVFGLFAGMTYWFPKAFGFKLDPWWGKVGLLGLGDRLLGRVDANLRRGADGHDAARPPFRRSERCSRGSSSRWSARVIILVGILGFVMSIVMGIVRREALARRHR